MRDKLQRIQMSAWEEEDAPDLDTLKIISANVYYYDTGERFLRPYVIERIAPKRRKEEGWNSRSRRL